MRIRRGRLDTCQGRRPYLCSCLIMLLPCLIMSAPCYIMSPTCYIMLPTCLVMSLPCCIMLTCPASGYPFSFLGCSLTLAFRVLLTLTVFSSTGMRPDAITASILIFEKWKGRNRGSRYFTYNSHPDKNWSPSEELLVSADPLRPYSIHGKQSADALNRASTTHLLSASRHRILRRRGRRKEGWLLIRRLRRSHNSSIPEELRARSP